MNLSNRQSVFYVRRPTHVVMVGGVAVGGNHPVRIQSMVTAKTTDTPAVIKEMKELINAGCEIIRVTVPTQVDCDNLPNIRHEMKKQGITVPLVADIHFTPSVAMEVVEYVDKVRINPGNFADKKLFKVRDYSNEEYEAELARIREKFLPLVVKCREMGVAMRIGTNHGSLSDRIMNRYGDTPEGMVESAIEFLQICEENDYRDVILSMKASNVCVMIHAYRLLVNRLDSLGWTHPLHLGVTEAGEGEDGRIKSAIGIGNLLQDGLGDTIRVSLTEDAVCEIPVAREIVTYCSSIVDRRGDLVVPLQGSQQGQEAAYSRRPTSQIQINNLSHGSNHPIRIWLSVGDDLVHFQKEYQEYLDDQQNVNFPLEGLEIRGNQKRINEFYSHICVSRHPELSYLIEDPQEVTDLLGLFSKIVFVVSMANLDQWLSLVSQCQSKQKTVEWFLCPNNNVSLENLVSAIESVGSKDFLNQSIFSVYADNPLYMYRRLAKTLNDRGLKSLLHLRFKSRDATNCLIPSSIQIGASLMDGLGDSIQIDSSLSICQTTSLSYNMLQACRLRITKTEYISCPSCGRTQFDLQTTTDRIREKTSHLVGVKIAVMGCIVNGPGEMADADFGYVGTGPSKVSLYVGKECVEKNIPEQEAVEQLINLIKTLGRWVEARCHEK